MRKICRFLVTFMLLLQLTACTGLPAITISQETPAVTVNGSQTQGTGEEQQLAQRLFKQINQDRISNNLPPLAWERRLMVVPKVKTVIGRKASRKRTPA